jgi:hypothetical protein
VSRATELWQQLRASRGDDDEIYPVLADVLLEAGDPLGELMSVQLEIPSARKHHLLALRIRERDLLVQLHARLVGGLPAGEYMVRRGVVAAARLGVGFVASPRVLAERTFLDELWLRVNFDPKSVVDHPATPGVRTLVFGIPKNVRSTPLGLPRLEDLRVLAAGDETCDLIAANPSITSVTLDRVRIERYASVAKFLGQVTTLKLRTWIAPGVMEDLVDAPIEHLEVLRVPGHEVGVFIPRLVARALPKLRELDLRGVDLGGATRTHDPMTQAGVSALLSSPLRPTKLGLGVAEITNLEPLWTSPLAAGLEELIVERIALSVRDTQALAALPRLVKLTLLGCKLDDAAAAPLISPRWQLLDLRDNPGITARGPLVEALGGDAVLAHTDAPGTQWIEVT